MTGFYGSPSPQWKQDESTIFALRHALEVAEDQNKKYSVWIQALQAQIYDLELALTPQSLALLRELAYLRRMIGWMRDGRRGPAPRRDLEPDWNGKRSPTA